ncbi:MAG: prepilin-type N-terminal cleavage/methylation domain-containing protein, partial [Candidatus Dojkabacteria bacterium]
MRSYTKITKGFSLVELVLAMALFSALVLAMSGGFAYAIQSTQIMAVKNKAVFIADEGLEAARSIRNEAFTNLTNGTFGLAQTGNKWVLSGASDVIGTYTRSLTITSLDSTTKQVVSTVSWTNPFASSVSYTLYLTDWRRVVSPAWSSPSLASTLNLTNTLRATKVAVSGNYAFVVRDSGTPNFVVVDISNSAAPSQVFSSTIAGNLSDIFISGNFAYITSDDKNSEFIIMSISPPTAPTITATLDMTGNTGALSVFVSGTKAYVGRAKSTPNPEFSIIDVSNPLVTPTVIGTVNMANSANSIYVSGTNVFIATSNTAQELTVINASNPAAPVQSGFLNLAAATTCS